MIRAVIIDDEDHARDNLKRVVNTNFNFIDIVGEGYSVDSALEIIESKQPDLVFLDIDLSDGSGFNVLDKLKETNFHVIFVTAFNDYAIKAFQYNALDYILKPINIELLEASLLKIQDQKEKNYITRNDVEEILNNLGRNEEDKKLTLKDKNYIYYVRVGDIIRCEADGSYTTIYIAGKEKVVISRPLKEYESILPKSIFFRLHQSSLINLHFVKKVLKEDGGQVIMQDGSEISIARRRKDDFFNALEKVIS